MWQCIKSLALTAIVSIVVLFVIGVAYILIPITVALAVIGFIYLVIRIMMGPPEEEITK